MFLWAIVLTNWVDMHSIFYLCFVNLKCSDSDFEVGFADKVCCVHVCARSENDLRFASLFEFVYFHYLSVHHIKNFATQSLRRLWTKTSVKTTTCKRSSDSDLRSPHPRDGTWKEPSRYWNWVCLRFIETTWRHHRAFDPWMRRKRSRQRNC